MNKILRVFFNTDLRGQHDGLVKLASKSNVNLKRLDQGEHVAFINRKRNKLKLFSKSTNQNVVTYLRLDNDQRLDLNCLSELIRIFNPGGHLDYKGVLKKRIEKKLASKMLVIAKKKTSSQSNYVH